MEETRKRRGVQTVKRKSEHRTFLCNTVKFEVRSPFTDHQRALNFLSFELPRPSNFLGPQTSVRNAKVTECAHAARLRIQRTQG